MKNAARVKFGIQEPVTKVPEYAAPPQEHEALAQQSELPAVSAIPYKPVDPGDRHFWEYQEEGGRVLAREAQAASRTDRVEMGAFARPAQAKPSVSVRDGRPRPSATLSEGKGSVPAPAAANAQVKNAVTGQRLCGDSHPRLSRSRCDCATHRNHDCQSCIVPRRNPIARFQNLAAPTATKRLP